MSHSLVYLLLAGLFVNGMHAYLLFTQRSERKWSISEHAIRDNKVRAIYIAGHFLGGFFFLLFAEQFLLNRFQNTPLFAGVCITVFFEYIQAVLPAKGKTNVPHTIAAYIMWLSFITVGTLSLFNLPLPHKAYLLSLPVFILLLVEFVATHILKRDYVWLMQMVMVMTFFVGLILMQVQ